MLHRFCYEIHTKLQSDKSYLHCHTKRFKWFYSSTENQHISGKATVNAVKHFTDYLLTNISDKLLLRLILQDANSNDA